MVVVGYIGEFVGGGTFIGVVGVVWDSFFKCEIWECLSDVMDGVRYGIE